MTYTLGQSVVVRAQVVKEHRCIEPDPDDDEYGSWVQMTRWVRKSLPEPTGGLVVGERTVADGDLTGPDFTPTRHFRVYLVAHHMRRKPMFVLPEDMEAVETVTTQVREVRRGKMPEYDSVEVLERAEGTGATVETLYQKWQAIHRAFLKADAELVAMGRADAELLVNKERQVAKYIDQYRRELLEERNARLERRL
jgi:hypothetical protein